MKLHKYKPITLFISFLLLVWQTTNTEVVNLHSVWTTDKMRKGSRRSSSPYITGDGFREYADHIIDYPFNFFNPSVVKNGDTIFVYPFYLELFFSKIHPQIQEPYILITHNGVHSIPVYHYPDDKNIGSGNYSSYLDDDKLIAWFGKNILMHHQKLFPIPIGIPNAYFSDLGNTHTIEKIKKKPFKKLHLLYLNFAVQTNRGERQPVRKIFKDKPFCYVSQKKPFIDYLQDMAESKFVLSPDGYGIECHRTWEAMLVGSIPIIKSGPLNHLYDNLPVLIVDDWNIITEKFLNTKYEEFQRRTFNLEKLYIPYWINTIGQVKNLHKKGIKK